jgi:hypothetical protein
VWQAQISSKTTDNVGRKAKDMNRKSNHLPNVEDTASAEKKKALTAARIAIR